MTQLSIAIPEPSRPRPTPAPRRPHPLTRHGQALLADYARDVLADVPEAAELLSIAGDLCSAGTLAESLEVLHHKVPAVAERKRWQNLMWSLNSRDLERAIHSRVRREGYTGIFELMRLAPLLALALVEEGIADSSEFDSIAPPDSRTTA